MQQRWVELPLNIEGVVRRWLLGKRLAADVEWVAPWLDPFTRLSEHELLHLPSAVQSRIWRLVGYDGTVVGPFAARAACAAARMGRIALATRLMHAWLEALEPDRWLAARGRRVLQVEQRRCNIVSQWQREWPRGILHWQDQPAWLVPALLRRFRYMHHREELKVYSGGHLTAPGRWIWTFPAGELTPSKVAQVSVAVGDGTVTAL